MRQLKWQSIPASQRRDAYKLLLIETTRRSQCCDANEVTPDASTRVVASKMYTDMLKSEKMRSVQELFNAEGGK